jgi:uncharacterized protein (DUF1501 family)
MCNDKMSRRRFLGATAQASMLGAMSTLGLLGMARSAHAAAADYKALVCLYMYGGNDGNNMIVPLDAAHYNAYMNIRRGSNLALSAEAKTLLAARNARLEDGSDPPCSRKARWPRCSTWATCASR